MVTIKDIYTYKSIAKDIDGWQISSRLVSHFCDSGTPVEIYDACIALGEAYMNGEPTQDYESYLGVEIIQS